MKFNIGDRVIVVGSDFTGWKGTVKMLFADPVVEPVFAYSVDLDEDQDPDFDMTGLYFQEFELEKI